MISPPSPTPLDDAQQRALKRLVVVGAGMAAYGFLRRMVQHGGLEYYSITLIGDEPRPPYDRVNLTDAFGSKSPGDLQLAPSGWYEEHGIELKTGMRVTRIDRVRKRVVVNQGPELPYEELVLATGSKPFVPPIPGVDLPGVFVYRTIEDIEQIQNYAKRCQTAAVLGGGLLGLEASKALHDLQIETHVLEVAPSLMPRQLNTEAGSLLKEEVEKLGVWVHLLRRAEQLEDAGDQITVRFGRDKPITVDMVVISAGIRPRDELASGSDLAVGERGGIAVNAKLQTEDENVHAIGECVSREGRLFGLVGPCYEMADVVADNLIARANGSRLVEFESKAKSSRLKLMGVDVSTIGVAIGEASDAKAVGHRGDDHCRTLLVSNRRRLVGAIGVGPWPERERLNGYIARGGKISRRQLRQFERFGQVWSDSEGDSVLEWPASATVCSCLNVTRGQLTDAMLSGITTADALAEETGASTVCGSCRELVCELAGQPQRAVGTKGRKRLLVASVIGLILAPLYLAVGPLPFAETVQSSWRQVDFLWQDSFAKQVTGYGLLSISLGGLLLSLRKRFSWFRFGDFGFWRSLHGILGTLTLVGFLVHTGLRMGHNFTYALAIFFLLINLLGACTGVVAALESRFRGKWGQRLRSWRPKLTQMHILLFWPFPVLVLFHIISVYYY